MPKQTSTHASYQDMIKDAILNLKERNGSSRQAIKKYIQANNTLPETSEPAFNSHLSRALSSGEANGIFARPKGPSGPVKLQKKDPAAKPAAKPAAAKKAAAPKKEKAEKVEKVEKKPAAAKKATPKKPAAKKATPAAKPASAKKPAAAKKAAATPKAKTKKAVAPAVVEKTPVVLGKTKSGRVTKTKVSAAPTPKKTAAKKKASATPATAEA